MGMLLNSFGRVSRRHLHSIRCEQSGHYNALSAPHVWPFGKALVVIRSCPTGREQPSPVADTTGQHKSEVSRELGTSELNASVQASPVSPRFSLAMKSFFAAYVSSNLLSRTSSLANRPCLRLMPERLSMYLAELGCQIAAIR